MPTTIIATPLRDPAFQRRVAKQLTFWWRRHGVTPAHVVTRFADESGDQVFIGPYPLTARDERPFAFAQCVLAQDRDQDFRAACAAEIRRVLGPEIPPDRVFVAIHPTDPADHFTPDHLDSKENTTV
ncbi:hypothetical protein HII36_38995 [Nonomuraea sp. NN258]|uniref:hypothetical protein n=1 Tax=Nonomuraea antri TaxID=2730852 RepID=UPI001569115B|nr:hypothetical protein [Nonomuraea antri]NRQ37775.1 hypothetical protein [Nonomuraea antri]